MPAQYIVKAESRHFDMISASWTDKHISILHVYFQVIIASLGISTPLYHREKIQFNIHLVIFASSWNVAPFRIKWEIPFVPLSSDLWIFGSSAARCRLDRCGYWLPTSLYPAVNNGEDPELLILVSKRLFWRTFAINDFIYLMTAWSNLPYHENYMDQYVKTMQSDGFHYYKPKS